jgi:outer membrane protein assembly factor BamB
VWVSPVDVESLTVGERIDVTDVFRRPILGRLLKARGFSVVGVADGLMVVDLPCGVRRITCPEGELAFWSPTDGLVPLDQLGGRDTVVAASGNIVVIDTGSTVVGVLDIVSGEKVASFELPQVPRPVTSACLSPDGRHVIVVGWSGKAVVGNIATGEVIDLNEVNAEFPIQQEHGIGWTTDDQLVFIGEGEIGEGEIGNRIVGFDITSGESFAVAQLDGPEDWWLTASGTMC